MISKSNISWKLCIYNIKQLFFFANCLGTSGFAPFGIPYLTAGIFASVAENINMKKKKKYKIAYPWTKRKRPLRLGAVPTACECCKTIPCGKEEKDESR